MKEEINKPKMSIFTMYNEEGKEETRTSIRSQAPKKSAAIVILTNTN